MNNLRDIESDRAHGKHTWMTALGRTRGTVFADALLVAASILAIAQVAGWFVSVPVITAVCVFMCIVQIAACDAISRVDYRRACPCARLVPCRFRWSLQRLRSWCNPRAGAWSRSGMRVAVSALRARGPHLGGRGAKLHSMTYKLVLLRHGQSAWNKTNQFTGWVDVPLTEQGVEEAKRGGQLLKEKNVLPDIVFTSLLRRAINTANYALDEADRLWIPVQRSWRLNERHYGALQGKNKKAIREEYGDEKFMLWRRSYATPPPEIDPNDSTRRTMIRATPAIRFRKPVPRRCCQARRAVFPSAIEPELKAGKTVLIVAHGNSLRAIVKMLDGLSEEETPRSTSTAIPRATGRELQADTAWQYLILRLPPPAPSLSPTRQVSLACRHGLIQCPSSISGGAGRFWWATVSAGATVGDGSGKVPTAYAWLYARAPRNNRRARAPI